MAQVYLWIVNLTPKLADYKEEPLELVLAQLRGN